MSTLSCTRRGFLGMTTATAILAGIGLSGCGTNPEKSGSASGNSASSQAATVRKTAYGKVSGTVTDGVEVYYNIPYGREPTGELRWHAPEEPEAWDGELDCSKSTKKAMQTASVKKEDGTTEVEVQGTTDCLNLDVYTTADAEGLPVMVYIHGGNNQTGTALEIPGTQVARRDDAVYVSLDYRLGLLGFNCLPALFDDEVNTGNFTLQDIKLALEWVRDNIKEFGGDPENVTVSGFSAGGRNVMAMLTSSMFKGLFKRAIAFSGGMTIADQDESAKAIAAAIAPLAVEDGKAGSEDEAATWLLGDSGDVRDYLFGIKEERLIPLMGNAGIRMSVFPHLYGDGVALPEGGFADAEFVNDVPLIMLTGAVEFGMFCMNDPVYKELGDEEKAAFAFASKYGSDLYRVFNTQSSAAQMADRYTSDIYLVQVDYGSESSAYPIEGLGSFHGIFAPALGSTNYDPYYDFSGKGYQSMAEQLHGYLKNFLYGTKLGKGMDSAWDAWTKDGKSTLLLDAKDEKAAVEQKDVYKEPAQIIEEIKADTSLSDNAKAAVVTRVMNGRWFSTLLDETNGTPQAVHLK